MKSPQLNRQRLILLFAGLVTLLTLVALATLSVMGQTPPSGFPPTIDPHQLPPPKQTQQALDYNRYATARAGTLPPPHSKPLPPIVPLPPTVELTHEGRPAGAGVIVDTAGAWSDPFPASVIIFNSEWRMQMGNRLTVVSAGAEHGDGAVELPKPWQGLVYVQVFDLTRVNEPLRSEEGLYKTPTKAGIVQIVDATGMTLKLVAEDGRVFYFDVVSRKFVSP